MQEFQHQVLPMNDKLQKCKFCGKHLQQTVVECKACITSWKDTPGHAKLVIVHACNSLAVLSDQAHDSIDKVHASILMILH